MRLVAIRLVLGNRAGAEADLLERHVATFRDDGILQLAPPGFDLDKATRLSRSDALRHHHVSQVCPKQTPSPRQLDALGQSTDTSVDPKPLTSQVQIFCVQIGKWNRKAFDEFIFFQLWSGILIMRIAHIDRYVNDVQISITES